MSTTNRRHIYKNPKARDWVSGSSHTFDAGAVFRFHQTLPNFASTKIVPLPKIAEAFGVKQVWVKDETSRLGLPAFKVLGASWATHQAIIKKLDLPIEASLDDVGRAARAYGIELFAGSDGNHGRAVAHMATLLGIKAHIYVPEWLDQPTKTSIASAGAEVFSDSRNYDDAILTAAKRARECGGLLIQDYAFGEYTEIAQWVVDGYTTLLQEIDESLIDVPATHIVVPVGVGSLAQAVTSHSKAACAFRKTIITVEPDTAACLWKSLEAGTSTSVHTQQTIMSGMNCGTLSTIAWPILSAGVDASVTVSDFEVARAVEYLKSEGVAAGPCGAAALAALEHAARTDPDSTHLTKESVVVLICGEGSRDYILPRDVSVSDPVKLTQDLVRIDSSNPGLSLAPGAGETEIASFIVAWLEHRNIETHWIEETAGRPSVVGVVRGKGGGKSLMFNGHIDTVTTAGYLGNPLSGDIIDGSVHGRGAIDMKSGIAASMIALARAKRAKLRGDVILAAVADEEKLSTGTEQVLRAGWRADGAIVSEPTMLDVVLRHKGFVWLEVSVQGVAAHGSAPELGIDAISKAGYFLVALDKLAGYLKSGPKDKHGETGTVHAGLVGGGEEPSSYPARCTITVERRTIFGETVSGIEAEIREILDQLTESVKDFKYTLKVTFSRSPYECLENDPIALITLSNIRRITRTTPKIRAERIWTDCALLSEAGIPAVLYGVTGEGLHARTEFATVESIRTVTEVLSAVALEFSG